MLSHFRNPGSSKLGGTRFLSCSGCPVDPDADRPCLAPTREPSGRLPLVKGLLRLSSRYAAGRIHVTCPTAQSVVRKTHTRTVT